MKKILYVVTKSVWGGAQQYVYDLATNLPKDRFEVAVAAGGDDGLLFEKLRAAGIRTIVIPSLQRDVGLSSEFAAFWQLLKLLRKERPDIIHLNSSKAGALGAVAAVVYRNLQPTTYNLQPKVIFTIHGWGFNEDRPLPQRALIFAASWLTGFFCDRIILVNRADWAAAERFISKPKLAFIPHGLSPISFLAREEARTFFAKKIGRPISADTILIGAIAELTKNKGLSYLIEAIRQLKIRDTRYEIRVLVIGDGEDRTKLQRQINAAGLQETVSLLGFIPDASRYLKGLNIFVLPSIKEGLPYALMQAMAAGLPIIATQVGGVPDLVANGEDGLVVPPKNPSQLGAALDTLSSSPRMRIRIGARARQKIKTKFSSRAMIENTIAIYDLGTHQ